MLGLNEEQKRAITSLEVGKPIIKMRGVSHPFQAEVTRVTEYGVNPMKFVTDGELRNYMEATFYDTHPEYLKTQAATTSILSNTAPPATVSIIDEDRLAGSVVSLKEFKEHYSEALSKARRAKTVEPLVDLLITEASRYAQELDTMATLALKIFVKATNEYNGGANPLVRMELFSIIERELAKRASADRAAADPSAR